MPKRMLKQVLSFKSRIALVMALLVFFTVGVVTATSLLLAKREMRGVLGAEQYATLSGAAAYVDNDFDGKKALLRVVAEAVPQDILDHPERVQQLLEHNTTLREEFFNVIAIDAEGDIIASLAARLEGDPVNVRQRDYFRDTVNYREGVVSAPFKSRLSGKPVVLVTQPVTDSAGRLKYILGGSLDLSSPRIFGQLQALHPGTTGYLTLLTGDGTIVLHPDRSRVLNRVDQEPGGATESTADALAGFEGWTEGVNKAGVPALLTYRRLRTNDWIITSVYPSSEAFAPFARARDQALASAIAIAGFAGVTGWLGIAFLLRPLSALQRHVGRVSEDGGDLEVFNVQREDEFGRLSRAFYALSKKREAAEAALAGQAMTDPLTGLHNRRMFDSAIAQAFARAERNGGGLALAYLDIDRFKAINDTYGHGGGDQVLVEFAQRLRGAVRITDTVVRIAGDEFVVVFEAITEPLEPDVLGQKIVDAMRAPMRVDGAAVQVGVSVGICAGATAGSSVADFIKLADAALYRSKQGGRGRYSVHWVGADAPVQSVGQQVQGAGQRP